MRILEVLAVAFSLAGLTGAVLGLLCLPIGPPFVTGIPTLLAGIAWATRMTVTATGSNRTVSRDVVVSVPYAAANAGLAFSLAILANSNSDTWGDVVAGVFIGFAVGASVGGLVWIPMLVVTLVVFGVPMGWARSLAAAGITGEERGRRGVGLVCGVVSAVTVAVVLAAPWEWGRKGTGSQQQELVLLFAGPGICLAAALVAATRLREYQRRAFVARAGAGDLPGYGVAWLPRGRALVQTASPGDPYRVIREDQPLFLLDAEGNVGKPLWPVGAESA